MPDLAGLKQNPAVSSIPSHFRWARTSRPGDRNGRLSRAVCGYGLSLTSLIIPITLTLVLAPHPSLGPIISLSFVIAVSAAAWWGGLSAGILVSCAIIPAVTLVVTRGKVVLPPHIDPVGLLVMFFISILVGRVATTRKRVERVLRTANEELEEKVSARTADLSETAASLEAEVTEHRKTEEQLRQSEQRYRLLFEDSPLAMIVFDAETLAFLAVNETAEELYGYTRQELLRMKLPHTWPTKDVPAMMDVLETIKKDEARAQTFITQPKSGKLMTLEARMRTIDFGGRRAQLALVTDVTEHKRLELQLRQSQKMEAIGSLAGGIAHDFNNLLTVILGYTDSILRKLNTADPICDKVSEIQAAGQRAANLTKQLLAFSRKQILKPQVLELNSVVSSISRMLQRLIGEDIQVSLHLDANLGQIQADPTQLEQVLINLAVNARDAMPTGGQLVIETHNIELDGHMAPLQGVPPGDYVLLVVSDTGCGMDEQTKTRVFEPFFTTKEVGKGTGLGLSMVFGVVQQSGGTVTIYSEVGIGTTFKIYLPRLDAPVPQIAEPIRSHSLLATPGDTILLVEDEPSLRALAREVLREAGYIVFEAASGKEALQVAETFSAEPALLLTDVVMPEMSGLELAQQLGAKWPGLAVIYTSGYTDHALLERNALRQDMPFLQKPYMPDSLLEQVAAVLEKKRRPFVLIVDDEKQIRDQLRASFESLGYPVLDASNGRQAMAQVRIHPIKLVITDLVMPEQDGMEMIQALRRSYPDVKIIAISGACGGAYLGTANKLGADRVLQKPFGQEQVLEMAEALLV